MKIYPIEEKLGLKDKIEASLNIPVIAEVTNDFNFLEVTDEKLNKLGVKASVDDFDLYKVYSILVSTVWNKNDDVFVKEEVWKARHTPIFKRINIDHDEKQIVGGIIDSWAVDENYDVIADETPIDQVPNLFHLLVASVVYTKWEDKEYEQKVAKLIEEIEAGNRYVSMECLIRGFDYAVIDPEGKQHIIPRNEETAFLTSKLRCYGGDGVYQDHKIGRLLRNVVFSGKGFVYKPANPDSVIFKKDEQNFAFAADFGVTNIAMNFDEKQARENKMSDNILQDQVKELKELLASLKEENAELKAKLEEANVAAYEEKINDLKASVEATEKAKTDADEQLAEAQKTIEDLQAKLDTSEKSLEELKAKMHKMEKEQKKQERKDKMTKAGLDEKTVAEKIEVFADLNDEQFEAVLSTLVDAISVNKDEDNETATAEDVVEDKEVDAVSASVAGDDDDDKVVEVRASLQKWIEKVLE